MHQGPRISRTPVAAHALPVHREGLCILWIGCIGLALLVAAAAPVIALGQQNPRPTEPAPTVQRPDPAGNFPVPDPVTREWVLQFTHQAPDTLSVEIDGQTQWYWYLPYEVLNASEDPRLFLPSATILTDRGHVITANRAVAPKVFAAVKKALRDPLIEGFPEIVGEMLPGLDYAKRGVFIWPVPRDDVDEMSIFVTGIYGETKPILDPTTGEPLTTPMIDPVTEEPILDAQGNPRTQPVLARRTLQLLYETPGTPRTPQRMPVRLLDRRDVMR